MTLPGAAPYESTRHVLNALSSLTARLELAGDHISAGVVYPVAKPMSIFSLFIGFEPGIDQHPVPLVVLQIMGRPSVPTRINTIIYSQSKL
jgi:hypothetical protein